MGKIQAPNRPLLRVLQLRSYRKYCRCSCCCDMGFLFHIPLSHFNSYPGQFCKPKLLLARSTLRKVLYLRLRGILHYELAVLHSSCLAHDLTAEATSNPSWTISLGLLAMILRFLIRD